MQLYRAPYYIILGDTYYVAETDEWKLELDGVEEGKASTLAKANLLFKKAQKKWKGRLPKETSISILARPGRDHEGQYAGSYYIDSEESELGKNWIIVRNSRREFAGNSPNWRKNV